MIYKRGKQGTYWFRFRFGGRFVHESARTASKTVAREAEQQRRRELMQSWNKIERRTLPPTFQHAAKTWMERAKPHLAKRTQEIYDVAVRCHLKGYFGSRLLNECGGREIAAYQAKRKREGASARTLNKELQVLRQILKSYKLWANLQGDVRFEREREEVGQALSPEAETKLIEACRQNPMLETVVTLALHTALRKGEIRLLRWGQIDFDNRTLTVGDSKTEGGRGRVLPVNPIAYAAMAKWAGRFPHAMPENYVFPACESARLDLPHPCTEYIDASKPVKDWRTAWRNALKRAGLRIRFHDLRHCCIAKLSESQASEQTIMAIAGHLSRKMLEHYSHIRMQAKRTALDAIAHPDFGRSVNQNVHQI
jgi:integrase